MSAPGSGDGPVAGPDPRSKLRTTTPRAPIAWTGLSFPAGTITRSHVTVPEFALRASISTRKAWELIAASKVTVTRWGARTTRISVAECERFLADGEA